MPSDREPVATGSLSIAEVLSAAVARQLRDGVSELSRAEGNRGTVRLTVELQLGDHGEFLWYKPTLYFEQHFHHKDREAG